MIKKRGQKIIIENNPQEQKIRQLLDLALVERRWQKHDEEVARNVLKLTLSKGQPLTDEDQRAIMHAVVDILYRSLEKNE